MSHGHHHHHNGDDHHHHHAVDLSEVSPEEASAGWHADNVELRTVGVDVGSSTSHLMFSRLHLQRLSQSLSSRFVVVEREVLHRSPILLTPYRDDGLIDVEALSKFVERAYREAGVSREDVDTGAVILTGTALERANARAVADLFAEEGGKFVCASAGHSLEALLAAHGSGAVALSRQREEPVLNVDIGGGTSKLSLVHQGQVLAVTAVTVGARLVAFGDGGEVTRIEPAAMRFAKRLGIELKMGEPLDKGSRTKLAEAMAETLIEAANDSHSMSAEMAEMLLVDPLPAEPRPHLVTFSGGTSEFIYGRAEASYGDLAEELSEAVLARRDELPGPIVESTEQIRATVVGASQFSVQLSGNTIYVSDEKLLPLRNVPVALARLNGSPQLQADEVTEAIQEGLKRLDLEGAEGPVAVALPWRGEPIYGTVRALAEGVLSAHKERSGGDSPIVLALDGDVGVTVGNILVNELGVEGSVVSVDGLELSELDFVDVGEVIRPANVVPVVIKSLIFPDPDLGAARSL